MARQAKRYAVMDGDLYRRSANRVLLERISQEEGRDLLVDIPGGESGSHASSRTLVGRPSGKASTGQPSSRMPSS